MRATVFFLVALLLVAPPAWSAAPSSGHAAGPPRVTIVFEHSGPSLTDLAPIYAMHLSFVLGIFPKMRYSAQIAREAAQRGLTPILHLPIEARNPPDMGAVPGAA